MLESRKRANKKWNEKNKEKTRYYTIKSNAKKFINEVGTKEDLEMLKELLNNRLLNIEI